MSKKISDQQLEAIQERNRQIWNKLMAREAKERKTADAAAKKARSKFRVVN